MTRRNSIQTIHEPFGDAFYFGPERLGDRFEDDEEARKQSGYSESTFATIMERIEREAAEVRFISFHSVAKRRICPYRVFRRLANIVATFFIAPG